MSKQRLIDFGRRGLEHFQNGTQDRVDQIFQVPADNYTSAEKWELEMKNVFRRLPLVLSCSSELSNPGSYHSLEVLGVPVLVTRGEDGVIRAFLNSCTHRGAIVVPEGTGTSRRHACPYHAWTYNSQGDLVGVYEEEHFGQIDYQCNGLVELPCDERAGLIWVTLSTNPVIDIDTFLCGYGEMLEYLGLADCHVVGRQVIEGPNWKVAYDGYLDLYHLPVLHRNTFGPEGGGHAVYDSWGPHQRATRPDVYFSKLEGRDENDWLISELVGWVLTIFPHVSIAGCDANGKIYMLSQLFPGSTPESSKTIQTFLHTQPPDEQQADVVKKQMDFLRVVVEDEDYFTGIRLQKALNTGMKEFVHFGLNEGGGQRFHQFLEKMLNTTDDEVPTFFKESSDK